MNDTELTDTERDILLTRCECGHTINDHGSIGHCWLCLDDGRPDCAHDFEDLLAERVARIVAARVADAHAELALAWDHGEYHGREYQKRLLAWGGPLGMGPQPKPQPNPYRAAQTAREAGGDTP